MKHIPLACRQLGPGLGPPLRGTPPTERILATSPPNRNTARGWNVELGIGSVTYEIVWQCNNIHKLAIIENITGIDENYISSKNIRHAINNKNVIWCWRRLVLLLKQLQLEYSLATIVQLPSRPGATGAVTSTESHLTVDHCRRGRGATRSSRPLRAVTCG